MAGSHLSRPIGDSFMMVPTLALNFCAACFPRHFHTRARSRYVTSLEPQRGHSTPFGQRIATTKARQFSGLSKWRTASRRVRGVLIFSMKERVAHDGRSVK